MIYDSEERAALKSREKSKRKLDPWFIRRDAIYKVQDALKSKITLLEIRSRAHTISREEIAELSELNQQWDALVKIMHSEIDNKNQGTYEKPEAFQGIRDYHSVELHKATTMERIRGYFCVGGWFLIEEKSLNGTHFESCYKPVRFYEIAGYQLVKELEAV